MNVTILGQGVPEDLRHQLDLLIATPAGTVVFDRDFGLDTSFIDLPPDEAAATMAAELAEKIERYLPRLEMREIVADGADENGTLRFKVVIGLVN